MDHRYLLDTHTLIWFLQGNSNLPQAARNKISDPDNDRLLSIVSIWEIAIKIRLGKLELGFDFNEFQKILQANDIEVLNIKFEHLAQLSSLEPVHRDPFDRLIISQAIVENITLLSKDRNFNKYSELNISW